MFFSSEVVAVKPSASSSSIAGLGNIVGTHGWRVRRWLCLFLAVLRTLLVYVLESVDCLSDTSSGVHGEDG